LDDIDLAAINNLPNISKWFAHILLPSCWVQLLSMVWEPFQSRFVVILWYG